jgi:uridine kinase
VIPLLVGIAGGSGSGKTTLARGLVDALPAGQAMVVAHDAYYRDLAHLPLEERSRHNFDEPAALDNQRLLDDLLRLREGHAIDCPSYDFATHTRLPGTTRVDACSVILVEGILVLAVPALREVFDFTVYVDACESIRWSRRVQRDVGERGRTGDAVAAQFHGVTLPMHEAYVAPSKDHADVVVSGEADVGQVVGALALRIARLLSGSGRQP